MKFNSLSQEQQGKLLDDYFNDYSSSSPRDPRRFLTRHPELLSEDAVTLILNRAEALWFQARSSGNNNTANDSLLSGIMALTISTEIKNDPLAAKSADFLVRKHKVIGDLENAAEWSIIAAKHQNCISLSYEKKFQLVTPFTDVLGGPHDDPSRPTRYLDSHPALINHEIMVWALALARAYYDAYKYFQGEKRNLFGNSAMNLANVAYFIARELKDFEVGIQTQELQLKLGQEIGASTEFLDDIRQHINRLKELRSFQP